MTQEESNEQSYQENIHFVRDLDNLQVKFYDNLEMSKRAIANWKKLRILIMMLKICSGASESKAS